MKNIFKIITILLVLIFAFSTLSGCEFLNDLFNGDNSGSGQQQGGNENLAPGHGDQVIVDTGAISFHFMMLGNEYAGDCIYVKAGEYDILIDAGSRTGSVESIKNYLDKYVSDGSLEIVIATHAHQDHIAGFSKVNGSIFDLYDCGMIIDFPRTDVTTKTYYNYLSERDAEIANGAKHYTADMCVKSQNGAQKIYDLVPEKQVKLEILDQKYYYQKAVDENDYSVCVQFHHGDKKFLFTGDLEREGELSLIDKNNLSKVELFEAGHHGSYSSTSLELLNVIDPEVCVVCCCSGSVEYTQNLQNTFPSQDFVNRIAGYTYKVYVPIYIDVVFDEAKGKYVNGDYTKLLNGNIVVMSKDDGLEVSCSNNNAYLKDTDWFKNNRICPISWK